MVTAAVLLAMPLCALQSRMLLSEIGTACGASLLVYGLVALGELRRGSLALAALDGAVALLALAAGAALGFAGGGALLGLVAPIGGVAAAGGLGIRRIALQRRDPKEPRDATRGGVNRPALPGEPPEGGHGPSKSTSALAILSSDGTTSR